MIAEWVSNPGPLGTFVIGTGVAVGNIDAAGSRVKLLLGTIG